MRSFNSPRFSMDFLLNLNRSIVGGKRVARQQRRKFRISSQENAPKKDTFYGNPLGGNRMTNASLMPSAAEDLCESYIRCGSSCQKGCLSLNAKHEKTKECFTVFRLSEQKDTLALETLAKKGKPASWHLASESFLRAAREFVAQSFIVAISVTFDTANCINTEHGKLMN